MKYVCENYQLYDYEDNKLIISAAGNGHFKCLKYLCKTYGFYKDSEACRDAVKNGHLKCLKYAYENGAKLDEWVFLY